MSLYSGQRVPSKFGREDKLSSGLNWKSWMWGPLGLLRCGEKLKFSLRDYVECAGERNKVYTIVNHKVILGLNSMPTKFKIKICSFIGCLKEWWRNIKIKVYKFRGYFREMRKKKKSYISGEQFFFLNEKKDIRIVAWGVSRSRLLSPGRMKNSHIRHIVDFKKKKNSKKKWR